MAKIFITLYIFLVIIALIKEIYIKNKQRKEQIALQKIKEQQKAEEKQEELEEEFFTVGDKITKQGIIPEENQEDLEEEFFTDVDKITKQGITPSDIDSLIIRLENEKLTAAVLFEAYTRALCNLTLEYLAIFCSDMQKEKELRSKISDALDCTAYLNNLPTEEDIDYANILFSAAKEVLEKALEYHEGKPQKPTTILKANEIQNFSTECIMFENSKGIEIGKTVSPYQIFRVDKLPFGNYVHKDELTYKGEGMLILTNKRIIFVSPSVTRDFKYSDILSMTAGENGIQISRTDKVRPEVFVFNRYYATENEIQTQFTVSVLQDLLKQQI